MIDMIHGDCMDFMATFPDKAYDLAIVDPPYGIGLKAYGQTAKDKVKNGTLKHASFDVCIPKKEYFDELFRVSSNQIICGGNYFYLPPCRGFIVWDKIVPDTVTFSQAEYLWSSFDCISKIFRYNQIAETASGHRGKYVERNETRIHPTQKPVALYKWLLSRYAKPGDRILDTHGGSGSICIACHDLGYDLTWVEKDDDYYAAACKRYKNHAAQETLFDPKELTTAGRQIDIF